VSTLNRQGNDIGTQYRSAIFYHNEKQKEMAEKSNRELEQSGTYRDLIVTEITPLDRFYVAEEYHKKYYDLHIEVPYCAFVIDPRICKLTK
jgi:peptide-methionine (S)-S-oxide reductase